MALWVHESMHQNYHLKFRNLKIKNLQFTQFFQNQFEKNCENFFNFQIFEIWPNYLIVLTTLSTLRNPSTEILTSWAKYFT